MSREPGMTDLDPAQGEPAEGECAGAMQDALEPGDFYYEGPYLVFTEAHHLKRGYCCNSGCRHCPYR